MTDYKLKKFILDSGLVSREDFDISEETAKKKTTAKQAPKSVKPQKDASEKTTLGDISELAALRTQMEEKEKKDN